MLQLFKCTELQNFVKDKPPCILTRPMSESARSLMFRDMLISDLIKFTPVTSFWLGNKPTHRPRQSPNDRDNEKFTEGQNTRFKNTIRSLYLKKARRPTTTYIPITALKLDNRQANNCICFTYTSTYIHVAIV